MSIWFRKGSSFFPFLSLPFQTRHRTQKQTKQNKKATQARTHYRKTECVADDTRTARAYTSYKLVRKSKERLHINTSHKLFLHFRTECFKRTISSRRTKIFFFESTINTTVRAHLSECSTVYVYCTLHERTVYRANPMSTLALTIGLEKTLPQPDSPEEETHCNAMETHCPIAAHATQQTHGVRAHIYVLKKNSYVPLETAPTRTSDTHAHAELETPDTPNHYNTHAPPVQWNPVTPAPPTRHDMIRDTMQCTALHCTLCNCVKQKKKKKKKKTPATIDTPRNTTHAMQCCANPAPHRR